MKLLLCFGTRPEAIKMAPICYELARRKIDFKICVTAQHREMLDQVLEFFELVPDYDLDLMQSGQSLNGLTANIFSGIDRVFDDWLGIGRFDKLSVTNKSPQDCPEHGRRAQFDKAAQSDKEGLRQAQSDSGTPSDSKGLPFGSGSGQAAQFDSKGLRQAQSDNDTRFDMVLVHGDTTTSSMVALAAFHRRIKVGHVEAGLRTYNKNAPFPEEVNRQLTARIADFHFAPTAKAKSNLLKEQIPEEQIFITGNTVVDALQWAIKKMKGVSINKEIKTLLDPNKKLVLITGHRRENFGRGLISICEALQELSEREDVELVYPVHLNPNVSGPVHQLLQNKKNIYLIPPVSYPAMLWLMQKANLIISDSGGIQEEAPTFKKPVLVTREVSERMEGVAAKFSFLVGTDKKKIVQKAVELLENPPDFAHKANPYGNGKAAEKIVEILKKAQAPQPPKGEHI